MKAYWIKRPLPHAPLGFGVTANSIDDALSIIRALDYGAYLPEDDAELRINEDVAVENLDQLHVVPNMGPIQLRGMWYPFVALGIPPWLREKLEERA